ncbi:hypothetical protein [Salipiger aestuarii]|uniref:hypothetical protein n=1 Tax=Salipiger aestuarii TaxID=568098 RepID=UPI00123911AD|nr:hypothetical protein [Salipiger aestuarii]KAA8610011.1 hypothetical protein AL037_14235 [Salipiger aestuarii]
MSRKLLLHIGCHKTGTSAIQRACAMNRGKLQSQGWAFADGPHDGGNWGNIFRFERHENGITTFRVAEEGMEALEQRLDACEGNNVILSAEDLFFLEAPEIAQFAERIGARFDAVTICAWLRRQDELAVSQKAQGAKTVQSALVFGTGPGVLPDLTPQVRGYLDFATRLEDWQRAFGGAELIVRQYHRPSLAGGDIVTDFFSVLGMKIRGDNADINATMGANEVRLLLTLREAGLKQGDIARIRDNKWIAQSPGAPRVARAEAERFYAAFDESNRRLAAVVGAPFAFHGDFSKYPETVEDTGYEAYEREMLLSLIAELSRIASPDRAGLLRRVGLHLEKSRPGMAFDLLDFAHDLNPGGPVIRQARERVAKALAEREKG